MAKFKALLAGALLTVAVFGVSMPAMADEFDLSDPTFGWSLEGYRNPTYTGDPLEPGIVVHGYLGNHFILDKDVDYTITFTDNINGPNPGFTARGIGAYRGELSGSFEINCPTQKMYRLYNKWSGEHFYTADWNEYRTRVNGGWNDEGVGWIAPEKSNYPVYRLYNPYSGDHHYTMDVNEYLIRGNQGWNKEGIGWYSAGPADPTASPLLREFNPNASTGSHNYTLDPTEHNTLVTHLGWNDEGTAWYGWPQ